MSLRAAKTINVREYSSDPSGERQTQRVDSYFESELLLTHGESAVVVTAPPQSTIRQTKTTSLVYQFVGSPFQKCQAVIRDLLLPIGYPHSVAQGYIEYQFYDSLQGICSYLRSVLCSAQVLQAAGVGTAEATALSAAMTWALKDGCALLGGLLFSYQVSGVLDSHVKEFRFFADIINNIGLTLDMLAPYWKNHLLLVSSAAGLCKTLCGLSAGATKSSLTQHFAVEGNMADVTAKESTQETFVSLMGMILGVGLAHRLQTHHESSDRYVQQVQWVVFIALTLLHVWSNYKGVALLRLRTLNRERAETALKPLVDALLQESSKNIASNGLSNELITAVANIPTPDLVFESLLSSTYKMLRPGRLCLNARLIDIIHTEPTVLDEYLEECYVLAIDERRRVLVCLLVGATCKDQLKAFVHALVMLRHTVASETSANHVSESRSMLSISQRVHRTLSRLFQESGSTESKPDYLMEELTNKGWDIEHRLYVGFSRRRFSWLIKNE